MGEKPKKKTNSIAFVSNTAEGDDADSESENLSEALALLARKFNRALRKIDRRNKPNVQDIKSDNSKSFNSQRKAKEEDKSGQGKGKQKKGMVVTWSDEDIEDEEELSANKVNAFLGAVNDSDSSGDEMTYEELEETYRLLDIKWKENCKRLKEQGDEVELLKTENENLRGTIDKLEDDLEEWNTKLKDVETVEKAKLLLTIAELQEKVSTLTGKLETTYKSVRMLNSGSNMLDEILEETSKQGRSVKGIDFSYKYENKGNQKASKKFIQKVLKSSKKAWIPKGEVSCLIAHTSFRVSSSEDWYFDSGCSKHMTGNKEYLENLKEYSCKSVTFGDGAKGKIKGIGKLVNSGSPDLNNVLLVKVVAANLISISQLCDQDLNVLFSKTECMVTTSSHKVVMRGVRSKDNCYMWVLQEKAQVSRCLISKVDELNLWHQRLGHINLKSMQKVISEEAVRGLPKLKIDEGKICGECKIGKLTKASHAKLQHPTTTKVLELLHMDLMGPMQVESLGEGISHEFSAPITPQQNVIVERKNRTLQESTRSHYMNSGKECYILADRDQRRKLDPKSDEGIFMGYSTNNKAYRVYNSRTEVMMESVNVSIDDQPSGREDTTATEDEDGPHVQANVPTVDLDIESDVSSDEQEEKMTTANKGPSIRIQKNHPQENIIGDPKEGVTTRARSYIAHECFISKMEPKNVKEALTDEYWINAMQEELDQFRRNEAWDLIP
ncbi:uncharacterized protein LOC130712379 [Lotus japonicus]|uniref:uncharacterized protein LOC130712379 n=1 Tax=Lotus japonicus TaxID=34305 RepID=UPI00258848E9|nr:uncharacterized protein LOC130712379 [Lotus japonicus]